MKTIAMFSSIICYSRPTTHIKIVFYLNVFTKFKVSPATYYTCQKYLFFGRESKNAKHVILWIKKNQNTKTNVFFFFVFSCIFIFLSRESDQCAIRARLGVAGHLSTTPRWGYPVKCLSQRHNKETCRLVLHTASSMLSVKQGNCEQQY